MPRSALHKNDLAVLHYKRHTNRVFTDTNIEKVNLVMKPLQTDSLPDIKNKNKRRLAN